MKDLPRAKIFKIDLEIKKAVQERSITDPNVAGDEYAYILDFLNKNENPKIIDSVQFILENFDKLLDEPEDFLVSMLLEQVVPEQTPKEFNKLILNIKISDEMFADAIYSTVYDELSHLVKWNGQEWTAIEKGYVDYLDKLAVFFTKIKDEKVIKPTWIDFIIEQIKDKDEISQNLVQSLKVYFKLLDLACRYKESDWEDWQLKTLANFGVLRIAYFTTA